MHFMHLMARPTSADLVFFIPHCFYVLVFKFIGGETYITLYGFVVRFDFMTKSYLNFLVVHDVFS